MSVTGKINSILKYWLKYESLFKQKLRGFKLLVKYDNAAEKKTWHYELLAEKKCS